MGRNVKTLYTGSAFNLNLWSLSYSHFVLVNSDKIKGSNVNGPSVFYTDGVCKLNFFFFLLMLILWNLSGMRFLLLLTMLIFLKGLLCETACRLRVKLRKWSLITYTPPHSSTLLLEEPFLDLLRTLRRSPKLICRVTFRHITQLLGWYVEN